MTDYRVDLHAWSREQADAVRRRSANELDWENIAEEIDSLGRQESSELYNRLVILIAHLLKWRYQPSRRGRSWRFTIVNQRLDIAKQLKRSPSLRSVWHEEFSDAYPRGRSQAEQETRLSAKTFPIEPPFTLEQALDPDWLPGPLDDQSSTASKGS